MISIMLAVKAMATEDKTEVEAHIGVAQEELEVVLVNEVVEVAHHAVVARVIPMTTITKSSTNQLKSKMQRRARKKR
jgi:hypothetical protein